MPLIITFYCFSIVNSYTISNKVHQMKRFTALSYGIQELLKAMLTVGMCHIIRIAFAKAIFEFTLSSKNSKSIKFLKTLYCNKRLLLLIFLNLLQKKKHLQFFNIRLFLLMFLFIYRKIWVIIDIFSSKHLKHLINVRMVTKPENLEFDN